MRDTRTLKNLKQTTTVSQTIGGPATEWSPIRSVIIRVMTKSDDRAAGVRFDHHEYDYRLNWTTRSLTISEKEVSPRHERKGKLH